MGVRTRQTAILPQPPTIELIRDPFVAWDDRAKVAAKVRELKALGFRLIGSHRIANVISMRLVALGHPDDGFGAVVYEEDDVGTWVELIALYRPGGSFTTSDLYLPDASSSSHLRVAIPRAKPQKLLELLRRNVSPYEELRYFNPHSFRGAFEDLYARRRKALDETGQVDVAAVLRAQPQKGGRFWKVALAGCATTLVVGLVAGWLGFSWISSKVLELGEGADQAIAEGEAFAAETQQRGCLDEALRRTGEGELVAAMTNVMFLNACLAASAPSTPHICEGVPPASDLNAAAAWTTATCAEYGRKTDAACTALASAVANYCEYSLGTLVPEAAKETVEE